MADISDYVIKIKGALDLDHNGSVVEIVNLNKNTVDGIREKLGEDYKIISTIHIKESPEELFSENKYTIHVNKLRE